MEYGNTPLQSLSYWASGRYRCHLLRSCCSGSIQSQTQISRMPSLYPDLPLSLSNNSITSWSNHFHTAFPLQISLLLTHSLYHSSPVARWRLISGLQFQRAVPCRADATTAFVSIVSRQSVNSMLIIPMTYTWTASYLQACSTVAFSNTTDDSKLFSTASVKDYDYTCIYVHFQIRVGLLVILLNCTRQGQIYPGGPFVIRLSQYI